jgi:tRNA(Ile)-lysidine synthase
MSKSSEETSLKKEFREYNSKQKLFERKDTVLLAVSGGIDSVTMMHLFLNHSSKMGVVHCNFQLRGIDSDEDELFVRNLCNLNQIPFYTKRFNTLRYAEEKKLSIQVAARELRYHYFEEVRAGEGYDWVAVAHNSDDTIETFFINLLRGTGIQGLTGIKSKAGRIIRPLLFASRMQIESFAKENKMLYRLDKSNISNKYKRNQIRNELIPLLVSMAPAFRKTILELMHNLNGVSQIYHAQVQNSISDLIKDDKDYLEIDICKLKSIPFYQVILPEFLRKYGYSADISRNILLNLDAESGKSFLSTTHRLVKDRSKLIITRRDSEPNETFYIDEDTNAIESPVMLKLQQELINPGYKVSRDPLIASIDAEKLVFPLILRHWRTGDYFKPLGMTQMKKLSDFFINEKFSIPDKERVWLLVSDGKIVWICGHRLDDRFKVQELTSKLLRIEILE